MRNISLQTARLILQSGAWYCLTRGGSQAYSQWRTSSITWDHIVYDVVLHDLLYANIIWCILIILFKTLKLQSQTNAYPSLSSLDGGSQRVKKKLLPDYNNLRINILNA